MDNPHKMTSVQKMDNSIVPRGTSFFPLDKTKKTVKIMTIFTIMGIKYMDFLKDNIKEIEPKDLAICALDSLGVPTREIAEVFGQTPRNINKRRSLIPERYSIDNLSMSKLAFKATKHILKRYKDVEFKGSDVIQAVKLVTGAREDSSSPTPTNSFIQVNVNNYR